MAQRNESRDGNTDTMMDKKRYPADDDPMWYEAEWPGYWDEDGNNKPAPRRLSSATLSHSGTRVPWYEELWFKRPRRHRAPYRFRLPGPTIECSSPESTTANRSRRSSELSKPRLTSPPPLSLSTCTELSEADNTVPTKERSPARSSVVQHVFPVPSVLPRPPALELHGLDNGQQELTDFYQPVIRKFRGVGLSTLDSLNRPGELPAIALVDTVNIWKGLSLKHCQDLSFIQRCVTHCLEHLLEDQFISFKTRLRSDAQANPRDGGAAELVEAVIPCRFRFARAQVIQMAFEDLVIRDSIVEESSVELLRLYLWSRDCFLDLADGSGDTAINACYGCYVDAGACCPWSSALETVWAPDCLTFEGLDVLPQEGSSIIIKPRYRMNAPRRLGDPFTLVTYTLESDHPWLRWDDKAGAFQGRVPHFSQNPSLNAGHGQGRRHGRQGSQDPDAIHVLCVEVKALVVSTYPGSEVCFERTIRARVSLRVRPAATRSSQAQTPDEHSAKSTDNVMARVQDGQIECQHKDSHHSTHTLPAVAPTVDRLNVLLPSQHTIARHVDAAAVRLCTKESHPHAPSRSTDIGGLELSPDKYYAGNGQKVACSTEWRWVPTPRVLSNTPGIELKRLRLFQANPDEPIQSEGTPCDTDHETQNDSVGITKHAKKQLDKWDARWTRARAEQTTASRRWVDATLPSPDGTPGKQTPRSGSPRSRRSKPRVRTPRTPQTAIWIHDHRSGTEGSTAEVPSTTKRRLRSVQDVHHSQKRRRERSSKTSELGGVSILTEDLEGMGVGQYSKQPAITSRLPLKDILPPNSRPYPSSSSFAARKDPMLVNVSSASSNSNPVLTPTRKSRRDLQSCEVIKGTARTIRSLDRFAPLQGLSQDSGYTSSETAGDVELCSSVGAQQPCEQNMSTEGAHFGEDSACFLEDVSRGLVPGQSLPPQEDHTCSSPVGRTPAATGHPTQHGSSMHPASPAKLTTPTSIMFDADGGDSITAEERRAALQVSTTKEAIEACREPGLSDHERSQMFDALKKTFPRELLISEPSKTCETKALAWYDNSVTEADAEPDNGSTTDAMMDSAEESDEDSNRNLGEGLVGGVDQDLRGELVFTLSWDLMAEEGSCF
ncbi:MAG: hypothetical protein Q9208_001140 [Pyrenodesmia sp. 3 TL-2023]